MLDCADGQLCLHEVCSIQAIDTVAPENAVLFLNYILGAIPLFDKEAELFLDILQLGHELIDLIKSIAMRLTVEVIPYVLHRIYT